MIIYTDSDVCQWQLTSIGIEFTRDIDLFLNSQDIKLAILHIPFPFDRGLGLIFDDKIQKIYSHCDQICILGSELHGRTVDFIRRWDKPKISFFICGFVDGVATNQWMDWFITSSHFYKKNLQVLSQLSPYQIKPKYFDILLGRCKPHRTIIYNFINDNLLNDRVIMTYLKGDDRIPLAKQDKQGWIWEDTGLELPNHEFNWTVTPIRYYNQGMSLSQVIPISVYNQTAYSIVAETNFDNQFSFYTEKIVKPILAERLFVVFSGQHYLRNLRRLGFKTFDGIINESYDTVADHNLRFKLACEQIEFLINQPQENILAQIRSITEHNKTVMIETAWWDNFSKELQAVVLDHTKQN